jgi:hypothetical protein
VNKIQTAASASAAAPPPRSLPRPAQKARTAHPQKPPAASNGANPPTAAKGNAANALEKRPQQPNSGLFPDAVSLSPVASAHFNRKEKER